MFRGRWKLRWLAVAGWLSAAAMASAQPANDTKWRRNKYLLLDSRINATVNGATLEVGTVAKHPANPLFSDNSSWGSTRHK
jgi:hypothetical protein